MNVVGWSLAFASETVLCFLTNSISFSVKRLNGFSFWCWNLRKQPSESGIPSTLNQRHIKQQLMGFIDASFWITIFPRLRLYCLPRLGKVTLSWLVQGLPFLNFPFRPNFGSRNRWWDWGLREIRPHRIPDLGSTPHPVTVANEGL